MITVLILETVNVILEFVFLNDTLIIHFGACSSHSLGAESKLDVGDQNALARANWGALCLHDASCVIISFKIYSLLLTCVLLFGNYLSSRY